MNSCDWEFQLYNNGETISIPSFISIIGNSDKAQYSLFFSKNSIDSMGAPVADKLIIKCTVQLGPDIVEKEMESTHLLYAQYTEEFSCYVLPIPVKHSRADELITVFSREINILNKTKDFFDVFNTLQHHRETALETLGYFTFDPNSAPSDTLITVEQEIVPVRKLDRVWFYENQFKDITSESAKFINEEKYVYLMVDDTNGLIKIGRSKKPKYREGTLQSKELKTHLIAHWKVPKQIENELHKMFRIQRVRGEWFRLTISDLDEIKDYMESLCKLD